jgi:ABC-type glycerol-3-phosphate transport system permease component
MIPESVTLIPRFAIIIKMGWIDTYTALIMPYFLGSALGTFLMRQFFFTIPIEIEDAARIDGANSFCIFWKVMLPLIKPALATLVAITLVVNWNNFLWPLVVINRESMKVLSVGMTTFRLRSMEFVKCRSNNFISTYFNNFFLCSKIFYSRYNIYRFKVRIF